MAATSSDYPPSRSRRPPRSRIGSRRDYARAAISPTRRPQRHDLEYGVHLPLVDLGAGFSLRRMQGLRPRRRCTRVAIGVRAGVQRVFLWPLREEATQLELFVERVAPLVEGTAP
jgi:hypothetical protein